MATRAGSAPVRRLMAIGLSTAALLGAGAAPVPAADEHWQVGASASYSSGHYGTDQTTRILYVPMSVRRLFDQGDMTLTIPYVSIDSDGAVTLVGGVPNRINGSSGGTTTGTGGGQGRGNSKKPGSLTPSPTSDSGIGDIIFKARYYLLDEGAWLPNVSLFSRTKFPTADSERGLGTGEFDQGFGVETSKMLTDRWVGFADLGYTFIGDPPGLDLRNQWSYALGGGYYLTKTLLGSLFYEERTALVSTLANPRDLLFAANWTPTPRVRFQSSFEVGLSSGAPNYGLTGGLAIRF